MILTLLKSKIHRATVTQCDLSYDGSMTIDAGLLACAHRLPHEQVHIFNINTGARFTTYAIEGPKTSGIIGLNGAAARLAQVGDLVIICAYCTMDTAEAKRFKPTILQMDKSNKIRRPS